MNLNGEHLIFLAQQFVCSPLLSVIHLNDNHINLGPETQKNELLDIFGIGMIQDITEKRNFFTKNL